MTSERNPSREWQQPRGGPPPSHHRGQFSPYDSPSPYEGHGYPPPPPPPQSRETRSPPYGGGYHGYNPGPPTPHTRGGPPPSPPDYWGYDYRGPPPHGWGRGASQAYDSPGAPYDHRSMGPPPGAYPYHQPPYHPYPGVQRTSSYQYSPRLQGAGGPPRGPGENRHFTSDSKQPSSPPTSAGQAREGTQDFPSTETPPRGSRKTSYETPDRRGMSSPKSALLTTPVTKNPPNEENGSGDEEQESSKDSKRKASSKKSKNGNGKGDPLSLLAKVCKDTEDERSPETPSTPAPVPTSPAHRRLRPSPVVTPAQTPMNKPPMMPHPNISPVDTRAEGGYWAADAGPESFPRRTMSKESDGGHFPIPPPHASSTRGEPPSALHYGSGQAPLTPPGSYPEWPSAEGAGANLVGGSFDSYDARRGPPPPPGPYSHAGPPHSTPRGQYPPPRWSAYPSDPSMRPPYPPVPSHEVGPPPYPPMDHHFPSQVTPAGPGPYPPPDRARYYQQGPPTPMRPYEGGRRPPPSMTYAPYTYVQQPRLEEKTMLRKKFSWKHYPELERFLIAHRDDYLKHSNMNYTAEQKQYNNWLTERLLEVAAENHYAFDPDEFNFVAIRDRIRCYYKSYVQTARKRGLSLPSKTEPAVTPALKKGRTENFDGKTDDRDKIEEAKTNLNGELSQEAKESHGKDEADATKGKVSQEEQEINAENSAEAADEQVEETKEAAKEPKKTRSSERSKRLFTRRSARE